MLPSLVSRLVILLFGTLYPAYTSYKAVRNKDANEYVKCMMYWIVFALYCTVETFTDIFLSFWFPLYHELKILILLWLMSPKTRGSTYLYTTLVHPTLTSREQEIDEAIALAKREGYSTVLKLGSRGVNFATSVFMQTALKGRLQLPPNSFALPTIPSPSAVVPPATSQVDGPNHRFDHGLDRGLDHIAGTDDWMLGPSNLHVLNKRASPAEMFSDEDEEVAVVMTRRSEDDEDYVPAVAKPRSRKGGNRGRKPRGRSTRSNPEVVA